MLVNARIVRFPLRLGSSNILGKGKYVGQWVFKNLVWRKVGQKGHWERSGKQRECTDFIVQVP